MKNNTFNILKLHRKKTYNSYAFFKVGVILYYFSLPQEIIFSMPMP